MIGDTDTPEPRPTIQRSISAHDGCVRRLCDILLAAISLLVLFPIMILIALLLVGFGFSNPVFTQKRVGQAGRIFTIFKFRTLRDQGTRDLAPRVLRYANRFTLFLRMTGLDELPQFINVLRGDMALVGPRPHSLADHYLFTARIPDYADRLAVKPGMTGLAQIRGWRGPVCNADHLSARTTCDLDYIRRQSLAFDAVILVRTLALPFRTLAQLQSGQRSCNGPKPCLRCARRLI
ncbi:sugar transferase [Thalassospira sp. HJ]|uniref:sugar transferase n=1 Tax=Thalassospira sp. HJ TaxID=1616823 RepID=UPI00069888D0|nr:sugar transferase [Thalassospira sp. HJ]